jgi:NADPH-dependent ferric siderophore reductase
LVIANLNAEHRDTVELVARVLGGVPDLASARVTTVDRDGLGLVAERADGSLVDLDLAFTEPATDLFAMRRETIRLVARAREQSGELGTTALEREEKELSSIRTMLTSVAAVEQLSPLVRQITFEGGDLQSFRWLGPDQFFYVLAPPLGCDRLMIGRDFSWESMPQIPDDVRPIGAYYTVRRWRPDVHELDMQFVLHAHGEATAWARRAKPGDRVALWGPRTAFTPPSETDWYLLVADDTGLPALQAIIEHLPAGTPMRAVIEVADADERVVLDLPSLDVTWIFRNGRPAGTTTALFDAVVTGEWRSGRPYVWGGGESHVMTAVRKYVRRDRGLPREAVSLLAYWRHADHPFEPDEAD